MHWDHHKPSHHSLVFQSGLPEGSCAQGFGVCCVMRLLTCGGVVSVSQMSSDVSHILFSGDDKHDPAAEPELPRHLQRGRHLRLPGQEAVRQHLSDQVRDILDTGPLYRFYYNRLDFEQFTIGYSSSSPTGCVTGTTDVLSFSTPNQVQYPSVCGDISQQHSKSGDQLKKSSIIKQT